MFDRHAHRRNAQITSRIQNRRGDHGMHVEMLVGVHMVQPQPVAAKAANCAATSARICARGGIEGDGEGGFDHIGLEPAIRPHQSGDLFGRQDGLAVDQHHMQPTPRAGRRRARSTASAALARHHQAGGGEDTVEMGAFHRFVHRDCGAEIVSGDNQTFARLRPPVNPSSPDLASCPRLMLRLLPFCGARSRRIPRLRAGGASSCPSRAASRPRSRRSCWGGSSSA
jgi:hypothetical protein